MVVAGEVPLEKNVLVPLVGVVDGRAKINLARMKEENIKRRMFDLCFMICMTKL